MEEGRQPSEVWFWNPKLYINQVKAVGRNPHLAWGAGYAVKSRIDPVKHAQVHFSGLPWRVLIVDNWGVREYTHESPDLPVGVYPVWNGTNENFSDLETMLAYPDGEDKEMCEDESIHPQKRPVFGQEHKVFVCETPHGTTHEGRAVHKGVSFLAEKYPQAKVILVGSFSFNISFGMGYSGTCMDLRSKGLYGVLILPTGRDVRKEFIPKADPWIRLMGMDVASMEDANKRVEFNLRSMLYASEHWGEEYNFSVQDHGQEVDITSANPPPIEAPGYKAGGIGRNVEVLEGDRITCDTCSVTHSCKYSKVGGTCTLPSTETGKLASKFGTRDVEDIVDGLSQITQLGADRLEKAVKDERAFGELDKEVTKLSSMVFNQASKLAVLLDPARFKVSPKVEVNVANTVQGSIAAAKTPNQMIGTVVRELEANGVNRNDITPAMINQKASEMGIILEPLQIDSPRELRTVVSSVESDGEN